MSEKLQLLTKPPIEREPLRPTKANVMLINMEGEGGLSLHEPIGVGAIAGRMRRDQGITPRLHDTQPELFRTGRIDTARLAGSVRDFVNGSEGEGPVVVGFGVPIYSYDYFKAVMTQLKEEPPEKPMTVVIGNAIATYTPPEKIHEEFPDVIIVQGEGDEAFPRVVQKLARGEELQRVVNDGLPDLSQYAQPDRRLTQDILDLGGSIKIEASRGCDFGACTFCSRMGHEGRGGRDYRTVPETTVVPGVKQLLEDFAVTRFELTDEEAFGGDIEATKRLVSAWKSADLPRTSHVASLRVGTILKLDQEGILPQQREIGLDKVFMGVEGGSDAFLQQMAKGQKIEDVYRAIDIIENSKYTDANGREIPLEMEMGFITFSWRMTADMLRDNVKFMSDKRITPYISALFNQLEVRAGTIDERLLKRWSSQGKPELQGYDPDANFSINASAYRDVPFLDPEVARVYQESKVFSEQDESLYYALKSISRAASLPEELHGQAHDFYLGMKQLHLRFLQNAVGLAEHPDVAQERRELVGRMREVFGTEYQGDALDSVRREVQAFFHAEEVNEAEQNAPEMQAVCLNDKRQVLLVRKKYQERWTLPTTPLAAGNEERPTFEGSVTDQLGTRVTMIGDRYEVGGENADTTPPTSFARARLHGTVTIADTNPDIADIIMLSPDDILAGTLPITDDTRRVVDTVAGFNYPNSEEPVPGVAKTTVREPDRDVSRDFWETLPGPDIFGTTRIPVEEIQEHFDGRTDLVGVDIGAGKGRSTAELREHIGGRIIATDVNGDGLQLATAADEIYVAGADELPLEDGSVDYALMAGVWTNLAHFDVDHAREQRRRTAREVRRVLRSGGLAVVTDIASTNRYASPRTGYGLHAQLTGEHGTVGTWSPAEPVEFMTVDELRRFDKPPVLLTHHYQPDEMRDLFVAEGFRPVTLTVEEGRSPSGKGNDNLIFTAVRT